MFGYRERECVCVCTRTCLYRNSIANKKNNYETFIIKLGVKVFSPPKQNIIGIRKTIAITEL